MRQKNSLRAVIFTGLFAAIIFIGISVLRIPVPALVGRPFIHFGNALTVLAILFLGARNGAIAGAVGLGGFDLLNGYAATSWLTVLEVLVIALVVHTTYRLFKFDDRTSHIVTIGIVAGVTKIFTSYLVSIVEALMAGTLFKVAVVSAFFSLPATVINSISTAIIVPILYYLLRGAFRATGNRMG
ncbi:ECF transporter S component [Loigolactobacillus iwatensis]|uniref:ECF transporter S component n=1 Tax=Loigolactobacillus iwatensis TaxID=1267156 RepID=UPI000F7D70FD|nr:ECF transporter S component [Loigolactobacillus iwatensis]